MVPPPPLLSAPPFTFPPAWISFTSRSYFSYFNVPTGGFVCLPLNYGAGADSKQRTGLR